MNSIVRNATIVSTLALLSVGTAGLANAQDYPSGQGGCTSPQDCPPQVQEPDESGQENSGRRRRGGAEDQAYEEQIPRKRRMQDDADVGEGQVPDEQYVRRKKQAQYDDWKYDSDKHERRRRKDNRFKFFFGDYWYAEPYWTYGYGAPYAISCREGRRIVAEEGFRRVSTIECYGRTFTYLGWQYGDRFRVLVSRSGRIVGVRRV